MHYHSKQKTNQMQILEENILNVTLLEPRQKHPTIFVRFDELQPGESLTIHNDHDPKPLYYQLLGERGNIFNWTYLQQGPEVWKVRIGKNNPGEGEETLGEIATKDLRKAKIFKKYGIDFCCGGKKTVKEACAAKGLDVTKIEQELQQADSYTTGRPLPYNDWSLSFLVDYIVNTHHSYVLQTLPDLCSYAAKVAKVHGDNHAELIQVNQLLQEINVELLSHLQKEEKVLFPYIKALENTAGGKVAQADVLGSVQAPINMMEMEHEMVGKNLELIRTITDGYALPAEACASYSLLYRTLQEFEDDLHLHIHLENNILFPKALLLEKK